MAIASQLTQVDEWLEAIGDRAVHIGVDGGTKPISKAKLLDIASQCEWAKIKNDSRLPNVFPKTLVIGYGDFLEWCRSGGQSEHSKAYFLTASMH